MFYCKTLNKNSLTNFKIPQNLMLEYNFDLLNDSLHNSQMKNFLGIHLRTTYSSFALKFLTTDMTDFTPHIFEK